MTVIHRTRGEPLYDRRAYFYEIGDHRDGFAAYRLNRPHVDGWWALDYLCAATRNRDRLLGMPARGNPGQVGSGLSERLGVFAAFHGARQAMLDHFESLERS